LTTELQQLDKPLLDAKPPQSSGLIGDEVKRLALQASHYLAGFLGSLSLGLASFPVFTRVFPIAEYGLIDLAQKALLLLWAGAKMGLQNAAIRFHDGPRFSTDRDACRRYFSTMYFGMLLSAGTVAFVVLAASETLAGAFNASPLLRLAHFIVALLLLRSVGSMLWSFLRVEERTRAYNVLIVATKGGILAAVLLLLPITGRSAQTYFAGFTLVEAAFVAGLTIPLLRRRLLSPAHVDWTLLKAGVCYGAPLVVYEFAYNVLGAADRFLVRHFLGGEALGFYSVAYGLAQNVNDLLVTPLSLALTPLYMRIWTSQGRDRTVGFLNSSFDLFLMAAAGVLAIAAACSRDAVLLLASSKYAGAERLIPLLLAGQLAYTSQVFLSAGLMIAKRTQYMAGSLLASAALNAALNWYLLPAMGLMGGAIAAMLSYFVCTLLIAGFSGRLLPLRLDAARFAGYLSVAAVAWLAAAFVELGTPAANLAGRSLAALAVYTAGLYLLDHRVRNAARWLSSRCRLAS
jgi:O-antigen/teichoic acid export membrane protein